MDGFLALPIFIVISVIFGRKFELGSPIVLRFFQMFVFSPLFLDVRLTSGRIHVALSHDNCFILEPRVDNMWST